MKRLTDNDLRAMLYCRPEDFNEEIEAAVAELLERRAADGNEARELCFARYILGQCIGCAGEIRKLAEDTVTRAKLARRTR